ncbi:unnamed protein product [Rotaria sp. Silwood1]|nr:unnamed protein product [Rotaria sp. Silwood1]CAF1307647.1 unnamed protein product [Rotaria sp. Silwood1]CAF1318549.1 unnamed protein product [Rotaria sp. Silwood1]
MRKNSGSIYFIAFNIANILVLWICLVPFVYRYMTGIDFTISNLIYCRLRTYLLDVLMVLPSYYLTLASIDRTLVTSHKALIRHRSTRCLAFWTISGITLLWFLYYSPIWFFVSIQSPAPGFYICFFEPGVYSMFVSYSTMTITGFLPPFLMTIFGIMTMRNFRRSRVQPITNENNIIALSSKDRQLAIMLLFDIIISVVLSSLGSILFVYTQRIPNERKTMEQQALDYFLLDFGLNLVFVQASLTCYSNFIVSKKFRKNIRKLIWKLMPRVCRRQWMNRWSNVALNSLNMTSTALTVRPRTVAIH